VVDGRSSFSWSAGRGRRINMVAVVHDAHDGCTSENWRFDERVSLGLDIRQLFLQRVPGS
jgi:hypothetical protein